MINHAFTQFQFYFKVDLTNGPQQPMLEQEIGDHCV